MAKRAQPRPARRMTKASMKRTKGGHNTGALRNVSNNSTYTGTTIVNAL